MSAVRYLIFFVLLSACATHEPASRTLVIPSPLDKDSELKGAYDSSTENARMAYKECKRAVDQGYTQPRYSIDIKLVKCLEEKGYKLEIVEKPR